MTSKHRPISAELRSRGIVLPPGDRVAMDRAEALVDVLYFIGGAISRACRLLVIRLANRPSGLDVGRESGIVTDKSHEAAELSRKDLAAEPSGYAALVRRTASIAANENRADHEAA